MKIASFKLALNQPAAQLLAATVGVIVMLMPYHAFLSTWLGTQIGPLLLWKSRKEALLLAAVMLALVYCSLRPVITRRFLQNRLILLIFTLAGLHLVLAVIFAHQLEPTLAGLMTNLRFLVIFLLAQLVVLAAPLRATTLKQFLIAGLLVSTTLVSIFAILQVTVLPPDFLAFFGYVKDGTIAPFILVDEQQNALRAFSTLRGPNALGQFLLLPMALLVVLLWQKALSPKLGLPMLALALVALVLTGSRSAWLGAAVMLLVVGLVLLKRSQVGRFVRRYGLAVAVSVTLLVIAAVVYPPLRLAIFHSSPSDSSLIEGSTDKHIEATVAGIQDALVHPLGRGPGQAGPASFYAETPRIAENYYVQLAQEVGLIGLGLFIAILLLVGRLIWQQSRRAQASPLTIALLASGAGITVINFFLHGWADDPSSLVWWGLAGLALKNTDS